ncbi:hypothetical protein Pan216_44930 [Planctomycetes bacterium Pan216]|uniref:SGNH hydrolase-type esterase domain-containing protein n=1 Tax=Kolteria novifilia TaxID=2527975 RepID=A0A518B9G1_9BACT|nr:hypothetical protein Pan216_44930 [Planctomycetes bacterium Pan216]
MHQILVYADSLTWGIIPNTRKRLPFAQRWPGVVEQTLRSEQIDVRMIEDCLNGRRTVFDDPFKPGRNGLEGLEQRIEIHSPLSLVVLMLGTNDFQSVHPHNAWHAAQGIGALIDAIRRAPIEPGMPVPRILVIAPPQPGDPKGPIAPKFAGARAKSEGLAEAIKRVTLEKDCPFFDAGSVTTTSQVDGVHLDADQHMHLGATLARVIGALLQES